MKKKTLLILLTMSVLAVIGYSNLLGLSRSLLDLTNWDNSESDEWPEQILQIEIPRSHDNTAQPAYFLKAPSGPPKPLVVSLHTWSGDYSQHDPLALLIKSENWNYIHPNFQGPNSSINACLGDQVVKDIDDAIQYSIDHGNVDLDNIFVVGVSGGGYTALGAYLKSRHLLRAILSWAPISDLSSWFHQSSSRDGKYSKDILTCTASNGYTLNELEARKRSPLFWSIPEHLPPRLEIYAGLNDGHTGSVPISHSIEFYNRMASKLGYIEALVTREETIKLMTREVSPNDSFGNLEDRNIFLKRDSGSLSLVIFDGGHEMLPEITINRIKTISAEAR